MGMYCCWCGARHRRGDKACRICGHLRKRQVADCSCERCTRYATRLEQDRLELIAGGYGKGVSHANH